MKMKLKVVGSLMALLLCGAAMVAYAQGPGPEGKAFVGGHGHGPGMGFWGRELNLTDAQKDHHARQSRLHEAGDAADGGKSQGPLGCDRQWRIRCGEDPGPGCPAGAVRGRHDGKS